MTKDTNNLQISNANINESKLQVVYRLDFAIKLKEKGYMEVFSKRNPQKPWLYCWYFVKTDAFMADLQELMEGSKNERI